ncbi:MAG: hypothetical protein R2880_05250 [Deinococcales bacterium]
MSHGYYRHHDHLSVIADLDGWQSPRLKIRFSLKDRLELHYPDGRPFESCVEIADQLKRLREKFLTLGINPDTV